MDEFISSQDTVLSESVAAERHNGAPLGSDYARAHGRLFDARSFGHRSGWTVEQLTGESIEEFPESPRDVKESAARHAPPSKPSARSRQGVPRPVVMRRLRDGEGVYVPTVASASRLLQRPRAAITDAIDKKGNAIFWYDGSHVELRAARRRGDGLVPLEMVPYKVAVAWASKRRAVDTCVATSPPRRRRHVTREPLPMTRGRGVQPRNQHVAKPPR